MMRGCLMAICALSVSACVLGPEPRAPELDVATEFENALELSGRDVSTDWYLDLDDAELVRLVQAAQENNLDIAIAAANLDVARANRRAANSDLFPVIDGFVNTQIDGLVTGGAEADLSGSVGLSLGFDPDITGRNARSLQASDARLAAARLSLDDIRRLIIEAVVLDYISLRRAGARLTLLDETLELQERTLEIVTARFEAGLSPALDVDRAAADLSRSRASRGLLEADRKVAAFNLQVLTAQPPRSDQFGAISNDFIPEFASVPNAGVPADLLRNRPDVRRAEALLLVEMALIGVEISDLYPSLRLPGTVSARSSDNATDVGFNLSALVDIPLLDFGRRQAEVEAQSARADAQVQAYRATLLTAQQEVEAALVQVEAFKDRRAQLEQAGARSQAAYDQLDALYREGLASFIDVLDAQRTLIQIREQIVETDANLAASLTRLNAALGGVQTQTAT
jgi:NodT family efflux transporter outer membrane factor (OMF) lipoprotein